MFLVGGESPGIWSGTVCAVPGEGWGRSSCLGTGLLVGVWMGHMAWRTSMKSPRSSASDACDSSSALAYLSTLGSRLAFPLFDPFLACLFFLDFDFSIGVARALSTGSLMHSRNVS